MNTPFFDFHPSTRVVFGLNSLEKIGELARQFPVGRILLVSDPGIIAAGHVSRSIEHLEKEGFEVFLFDRVEENPTTLHVEDGLQFARSAGNIELIIALGGGSAMDCAKGINFLLSNGGKMEDYWGIGKAKKPMLPSIGVPTTAGTGSEAQSFALISHAETHRKMACGDRKARFTQVILDPALLTTMPRQVALVTAMDALSHALESYVCTRRNPLSQLFAGKAWQYLNDNFEAAMADAENLEAWSKMMIGAHFSGMAIENAMLGAAHATANPLTARFNVTHGIAVSLMLPYIIRYNFDTVAGEYRELMAMAGLPVSGTRADADTLIERLQTLQCLAKFPARLSQLEIPGEVLPELATDAAAQWTGNFNPRPVDEKIILEIYQQAY